MFSSVVYAQQAATSAQQPNPLFQLLPFVAVIAIFYFLLYRPQRKKQKELDNTINALKSGDKIVTTSGMFATIDSVVGDGTFYVTIANNVKVHIVRAAIAGKVDNPSSMEKK